MNKKINECSAFDFFDDADESFIKIPFFKDGKPLPNNAGFPTCCLSLLKAGSMRFRWNEKNALRENFFGTVKNPDDSVVPLELIHSKAVYAVDVSDTGEVFLESSIATKEDECVPLKKGDGIISANSNIIPVVTVADCVPVFLFDAHSTCFGVVHSGWKGTGIVINALTLAKETYGALPKDFSVVIGPHIHDCCYSVDDERAEFFAKKYGKDCVKNASGKKFLSLAQANISLLLKAGVAAENILHCNNCSCCDTRFGSFRRQTATLPSEKKAVGFSPMAAFVLHGKN